MGKDIPTTLEDESVRLSELKLNEETHVQAKLNVTIALLEQAARRIRFLEQENNEYFHRVHVDNMGA